MQDTRFRDHSCLEIENVNVEVTTDSFCECVRWTNSRVNSIHRGSVTPIQFLFLKLLHAGLHQL